MKIPLTLITALLVLLIATFAGSTLLLLRQMHNRAAHEAAAETVMQRGRTMVAHLISQAPAEDHGSDTDWTRFSHLVHDLHAVEKGLQYVSVTRDGTVVYHEQTTALDGATEPTDTNAVAAPPPDIAMRRELLQTARGIVPVVVFTARSTSTNTSPLNVEVALRKEIVQREEHVAEAAIASMFRLTFLTVSVAFGVCIVLVVWMMRREIRHEELRTEQEHLAFSGMLANGIVHDFRNPMSSLKLDVQMLHREVQRGVESRPERLSTLADRIRNTMDRMDEVFKAFLFVSRPDRAERSVFDITSCIREAVEMLAPQLERSKVKTKTRAPETPVYVTAFVASLRRALVNVLTNAIQFSPPEGASILITISVSGNMATIDICDQGPGIPPAVRRQVFTMFMTTRPEGTGLGLFLAKAAIERSNGDITITDSPLGMGACVRITLPTARGPSTGTKSA